MDWPDRRASAAALAYLGYLQVDNTIVTYNQTASRLAALERGWRVLSPAQQDEGAVQRLVADCESALATELSGWVQLLWVEIWVENHRCLEYVESGAA